MYTIDNTERWSISHIRTLAKARGRIWDTREWADKAGGYAIQGYVGARFVKSIRGDYYNVVGLPISRVYQELKKLGAI